MNIKKAVSISCLCLVSLFLLNAGFKGEKDPLHKRTFTVGVVEVKNDVPAKKSIKDELAFKDGKLYSDYLNQKFSYKWLKYRINKDSIYMDSTETEIRRLEVEATSTDEGNTTIVVNMVVENWDIEGYYKMTKNDKLKKYFDVTGFEKGGKPRKEKKKKNNASADSVGVNRD